MKWNFKWGKNNKQEMTPELTERNVNVYQHENKIKGAEHLGQRKCVECGKWFTPEHYKQVACSDECKKIRHRRFQAEWQKEHYDEIKNKKQSKVEPAVTTNERKEDSMETETIMRGDKPWTPPVKVCPVCGKQFVASSNRQVYCSADCARKAYSGEKIVKTTPSGFKYVSTAPTRPIKCEICGKSFVPRTKKGKYCSEECRKEAARECSRKWDEAHRSIDAGVKLKRVSSTTEQPIVNKHLEVATVVRKLVEAGVDDEIVAKYLQTYYGSK